MSDVQLKMRPVDFMDEGKASLSPTIHGHKHAPQSLVCVASDSRDNMSFRKTTVLITGSEEGVDFSWFFIAIMENLQPLAEIIPPVLYKMGFNVLHSIRYQ